MAVTVVDPANQPARPTPRRAGVLAGIHTGQVVATQGAVALWLTTYGLDGVAVTTATLGAVAVLAGSWVRLRRRWLYQWLGVAAGYATRRRTLGAGADPGGLLDWVSPGARVVGQECDGDPAGVIEQIGGRTALLELGHADALLAEAAAQLPPLSSLLMPGVRLHLVVTGVPPAAGAGAPATSYRQLTEGRLLAHQRAVLAVQALRAEGTDEEELRRTLTSAVRRTRRKLQTTVGARLLAEAAAHAVLADLAYHDGTQPAREGWHAVHVGGLLQATYQLRRWPEEATTAGLVPRLLALPAAATTVGLTVGPGPRAALAVRLAASSPAALTIAAQALHRALHGHGAAAERCTGEQAPALAATLPIPDDSGRLSSASAPLRPPATVIGTDHSGRFRPAESLTALRPAIGGAGLMLGVNRHGEPVTARFFRGEPTRVLLVGGVRAAQLVTLRALALGAQVVVQSTRPQAWEPFVRGVRAPGETIPVLPPGRPAPALGTPATALRPQLVVVDAGPLAGDVPVPAAPWRTALVVRDELARADLDLLARSELLVLQPLKADEAAFATGALGLGSAGEWLTHIRGDMVGVVNRRTVRWALLSATQVERQLLGAVGRG